MNFKLQGTIIKMFSYHMEQMAKHKWLTDA